MLSFIGRSTSITCSFTSEAVQNIEVHSDEGIINSRSGKNITFEFGKTTDVIHNKKYVCFGVTSDGNVFFRNFSIVALSK